MRTAVGILILAFAVAALLASHQSKPFELLIDEVQATTIVCNPQPTPELIRWHRSKEVRT